MNALLTSIYTLTPMHCGTGQAADAVDLPIAREASTRLPIVPATSIKGVLRHRYTQTPDFKTEISDDIFGPELAGPGETDRGLRAGNVIFGEGQILAYPFRSLNTPLYFATSPLLLERLDRALRSAQIPSPLPNLLKKLNQAKGDKLLVTDAGRHAVIIEDYIFTKDKVEMKAVVKDVAKFLANLLPKNEAPTQKRLMDNFCIIPDDIFRQLIQRSTPVAARIKLTEGKTTSTYAREGHDDDESGNLWYEETLPSDCLFWSLLRQRPGSQSPKTSSTPNALTQFTSKAKGFNYLQIGGNETVGQGQCWYALIEGKGERQ